MPRKLKAPRVSRKKLTKPVPIKKSKTKKVTKKTKHKSVIKTIKKPYTKIKKVTKKLNKKPSRKIIENKTKRFIRKSLKKSTKLTKSKIKATFNKLSKTNVHSASKAELREYIKYATKLVNEAYPTMNKASKEAMLEARKIFGRGDNGEFLSTRTSSRERLDLLTEKASMLEAIINGDGVSTVANIKRNMKMIKQFNTFKRGAVGRNLEGLTFEEYNVMVDVAGAVEDVMGEYYNSYIFNLFHEYKDTLGMENVGNIIIKTIKKNKPRPGYHEGWSISNMTKAVIETVKKEAERR